jgi:hypothetical protein
MKKIILAVLVALVVMVSVNTQIGDEEKNNYGYVTEKFVVQYETSDGFLNAVSIEDKTNAPYGFILENKYELGDIVEVTYKDDEIISERLITGEEEKNIWYQHGEKINAVYEEGMQIMRESYERAINDYVSTLSTIKDYNEDLLKVAWEE